MLIIIAIKVGRNTSHHDQLMTPTNLSTIKIIVSTVVIPMCFLLFYKNNAISKTAVATVDNTAKAKRTFIKICHSLKYRNSYAIAHARYRQASTPVPMSPAIMLNKKLVIIGLPPSLNFDRQ